jgi:hypothetical protein
MEPIASRTGIRIEFVPVGMVKKTRVGIVAELAGSCFGAILL